MSGRRRYRVPRRRRWLMSALQADCLAWLLGSLAPDERQALAQIVDTADLFQAAGRDWLLVPADAGLIDRLATFAEAGADLEPGDDDEPADPREVDEDAEPELGRAETDEGSQDAPCGYSAVEGEATAPLPGERRSREAFVAAARGRLALRRGSRPMPWPGEGVLRFTPVPRRVEAAGHGSDGGGHA